MDKHVHIEPDRIVEESACKYYKRLLVGFIRCFQDENGEVVVPEDFFDVVPDNIGFGYEMIGGENDAGEDIDVRIFNLVDKWKPNIDDCGGSEGDIEARNLVAVSNNVIHLKIVPDL